MNGETDGRLGEWIDRWTNRLMVKWIGGQMDRWTVG